MELQGNRTEEKGAVKGESFMNRLKGEIAGASKDRKKAAEKKLMDACVEMESIFIGKMLKEMRKTVHKGGMMNGGFAEEIFEDMLFDEYSTKMAKSSNMGIAKMLYKELSGQL